MRSKFIEEAVCQKHAHLLESGPLSVESGAGPSLPMTSLFVVDDPFTRHEIAWGPTLHRFSSEKAGEFIRVLQRHLAEERVSQVNAFLGPFPIEVFTTSPWHAAFSETMFRQDFIYDLASAAMDTNSAFGTIRIWHDPYTKASDYGLATTDDTLVLIDPTHFSIAIIGKTSANELREAAFSLVSYFLPLSGALPIRAIASCRKDGSGASACMGLNGLGYSILESNGERSFIGDDLIAWSERGLSNLEGGYFADVTNLTRSRHPQLWQAVQRFGTILEDVSFDELNREPNFTSKTSTRGPRAAFSLADFECSYKQNRESSTPRNLIYLISDGLGALPLIAKLDYWQAQYFYLIGYSASLPVVDSIHEPVQVSFHSCFASPPLLRSTNVYVSLLRKLLQASSPSVWLINSVWTGLDAKVAARDSYHPNEQPDDEPDQMRRVPFEVTQHLIELVQDGKLEDVATETHPIFGFEVPLNVPGLEARLLKAPTGTKVERLAQLFLQEHTAYEKDAAEILQRGGPGFNRQKPSLGNTAYTDRTTSFNPTREAR